MEKKKKKGGIGGIALILCIIAANIGMENIDALPVMIGIIFLVVIFVVVFAVVRAAKKNSAARGSRKIHSHDRLHPNTAAPCTDPDEHWKKQLDGFLEAGIIEKDEYRVLMNRRSRQYSGK